MVDLIHIIQHAENEQDQVVSAPFFIRKRDFWEVPVSPRGMMHF